MPNHKANNAKTGRPNIREFWVEYIARLMHVEGLTSPIEIFRRLEAYAEENKLKDLPSERTVNRYIKKLRTDALDRRGGPFQWPQSMGEKEFEVPWEAARDALDLLRWYLERNYHRPTVRVVQWYWRICQASGGRQVAGILRSEPRFQEVMVDRTIENRLRQATLLALGEVMPRPHPSLPSYEERIEYELAFQQKRCLDDRQTNDDSRALKEFLSNAVETYFQALDDQSPAVARGVESKEVEDGLEGQEPPCPLPSN